MSIKSRTTIKTLLPALFALGLSLGLSGCGNGGDNGSTLLGTPTTGAGSSASSASTSGGSSSAASGSDASSSSSSNAAGGFVEPISNKTVVAKISTSTGNVKFGENRNFTITFTDSKGAAFVPMSTMDAVSPCITGGTARLSKPVLSANTVSFSYTPKGCVGDDTVTVSAAGDGKIVTVGSVKFVDEGDAVASINFVSAVPDQLAISGSGTDNEAKLTFLVKGQSGDPIEGQAIDFTVSGAAGGVTVVQPSETSDSKGLVVAKVRAGTTPNVVTIVATHKPSGQSARSGNLSVANGLSAQGYFKIGLDVLNPKALHRGNADTTNVTVNVSDRAGNSVADGTVVNFVSIEGGVPFPTKCITKDNTCSVVWKPDLRDPLDGRARILATVKGAEFFKDNNSNLLFDDGDFFDFATDDIGEPYSDDNDNGKYDVGEYFVDSNANGRRDSGDGKWSGPNCKHSELCSTNQTFVDLGASTNVYMADSIFKICAFGDFGKALNVTPGSIAAWGGLYLSDGNDFAQNIGHVCPTGNPPAAGTKITFSVTGGTITSGSSQVVPSNSTSPVGAFGISYRAGDKESNEQLIMKVEIPGEVAQEVSWRINVVSKLPGSSSSSSSSSSSGAGNSFVDPASGKQIFVGITTDTGVLAYDQTRYVTLTFTDATGDPAIPTSTLKAASPCSVASRALVSNAVLTSNSAKFNYTAKGCVGEDLLSFTANSGATTTPITSTTITTKGESVGSITFVGTSPSQIAIAGSGGTEDAIVTFKLVGQGGAPVVREKVDFRLEGAAGGVKLESLSGLSDDSGMVRATVHAGTTPNTVTVVATHAPTGLTAPSTGLVVATGLSAEGSFNMGLTKVNVNAFDKLNVEPTDVVVAVTDLSGNPVLNGTVVNFISEEGGVVTPSCTTLNNTCTVTWKPDGRKPADGRVQIFATVKGTERFDDKNGNLLFDDGDIFDVLTQDLSEPYSDNNMNGKYDLGEYFVDSNHNGARDIGDGKWNGLNCKHSTLCGPTQNVVDLGKQVTVYMAKDDSPQLCRPGTFGSTTLSVGQVTTFSGLYVSDGNTAAINILADPLQGCDKGNPLPNGTTITFGATGGSIQAGNSYAIGKRETRPTGPYAATYKAPDTAGTVTMTMTIAIPSPGAPYDAITYYYSWSITVQ